LQAAFILSKSAWPVMCEQGAGSLLFVSSASAVAGFAGEEAYVPAQHGQEGLMKVLALAGRQRNVASNSVTPGVPLGAPPPPTSPSEQRCATLTRVTPELVAPAFRFLAAIDVSFSTGNRLDAHQIARSLAAGAAVAAGGPA
ncbi:MAG TPA: SDR family oxidoreductase, partial [Acidimicrobiales bacterium]|nr:SDR family oxidoreductase [Acidimicrobiales bacterium]